VTKKQAYNYSQQTKSQGYLECLIARPRHKLVSLDMTAIEPTVITSMSRDPSMWQIYGPDAKPNDIYLFTACNIRGLGDKIRKYYDPDNPTKESIKIAKKRCKKDRQVAKKIHLAAAYKAGPKKIKEELNLAGFEFTNNEAYAMHKDYWRLYAGVKRFDDDLLEEWEVNNGYVINGLGRSLTVASYLTKDLVNRVIQSSAHDLLMVYIAKIQRLRQERKVNMYPWMVDYHDETVWEVPEDNVDEAVKILEDSLEFLNEHRFTEIAIKGEVEVCDNLATLKCEE